jgi:hypothetical protein
MTQSSLQSRRILGSILLLFAIVLAVALYLIIGIHALLIGATPLIILAVMSILLLAGWPRQTRK